MLGPVLPELLAYSRLVPPLWLDKEVGIDLFTIALNCVDVTHKSFDRRSASACSTEAKLDSTNTFYFNAMLTANK